MVVHSALRLAVQLVHQMVHLSAVQMAHQLVALKVGLKAVQMVGRRVAPRVAQMVDLKVGLTVDPTVVWKVAPRVKWALRRVGLMEHSHSHRTATPWEGGLFLDPADQIW